MKEEKQKSLKELQENKQTSEGTEKNHPASKNRSSKNKEIDSQMISLTLIWVTIHGESLFYMVMLFVFSCNSLRDFCVSPFMTSAC